MAWKLGTFTIGPDPVRHGYWWGGDPKGPQIALASPVTEIVTESNGVKTLDQGFDLGNEGCVYWVDVGWEDVHGTGAFGEYDIWVGSLFGLSS